ncbi:DUF4118 domain-containing protein [Amycolatopsis rhabdoformis]|uniref:histidine kinase n=1 Tax=Amycolatopsis rhabdoformis TaxID=1448059 RepID=A0ABZ1IGU1_9PSEU|nr:DUF4118 domain-containing protein [Amycolatopsis rhabdoformis]WSE32650.1 DUF4118 domain-containing protein [Amycolatopsis rhabdoformis]
MSTETVSTEASVARRRTGERMRRRSSGALAAVVAVGAITGVALLLEPHVDSVSLLMLYLIVVLPVAVIWGTALAVGTSLLSVAVYTILFAPPQEALHIVDAQKAVALGVFLITAVVVGSLASRLQRTASISRRLTEEQSALRRVATLVARSVSPPEVFEAVTREVGLLCGADLARMERYEVDGTVTGVAAWTRVPVHLTVGTRIELDGLSVAREIRQTGQPVRLASFWGETGAIAREARQLGIRSSVGCPIVVSGRIWGVIAASTKSTERFPDDTEAQIANFTELVATAIENAEARAELRASRARIVATADRTRRRIERDLHDGAQQQLVSLALQVRAVQALIPAESAEASGELDRIATGLSEALDELREMARGIHPAVLAELGLVAALKALARRSPQTIDLDLRTNGRLPEAIEVGAYYVVAEALANTAKHASDAAVTVSVESRDDELRIAVHDDGAGGADFTRGTGLAGLKDRVEALGGRIFLHSPPGDGTTVRVRFPLAGPAG